MPGAQDRQSRRTPSVRIGRGLCALGLWLGLGSAGVTATGEPGIEFTPPAPGSYRLERIMRAGDGAVLDTEARAHRLSEFTRGKVTLLSFMYSSCADPTGCPYAFVVFNLLKSKIEGDAALRGRVRLASLSFDPKRDTPEAMAHYGGHHAKASEAVPWSFLTTPSIEELLPILNDYGQDVYVELDRPGGKPTGAFSHVLKVFLIDPRGDVREIYTSAYLVPEVVLNDIKTLLMEAGSDAR